MDKRILSLPLVLASASPRRKEILTKLGFSLTIKPAEIDEFAIRHDDPATLAQQLSEAKAAAVRQPGALTVAADTVVAIDGEILEKPVDSADARRMLEKLSGREHTVFTGVCIVFPQGQAESFVEKTGVRFLKLAPEVIEEYIATREPYDKAGAYGVQDGFGMANISGINGCYFNVMGFPASRFMQVLSVNRKFLLS